jgi:hypothetical protein
MTADREDQEFASLDAYITGQLAAASATLAAHTGTQARLDAVLAAANRATGQDGTAAVNDER